MLALRVVHEFQMAWISARCAPSAIDSIPRPMRGAPRFRLLGEPVRGEFEAFEQLTVELRLEGQDADVRASFVS